MRTRFLPALASLAAALAALPASAQLFRAYLASDGNDANPCTLSQPCRLLPAALAVVNSRGEIWMLDSANYNTATVNIAKSVTILAIPGAVGSLVASAGQPALTITAPSGHRIALRNLVLTALQGPPATGILHSSAELFVEDCVLGGFNGDAIRAEGSALLRVAGTTFKDIFSGAAVWVQGSAVASISHSRFVGTQDGVRVVSAEGEEATAALSDSFMTGVGVGAMASSGGGTARLTITRSTFDDVSQPISANTQGTGSATLTIGSSMITNGTYTWVQNGAGSAVRSLGNNHFEGNGGSIGTLTSYALQ